jgi:hypothetical protein
MLSSTGDRGNFWNQNSWCTAHGQTWIVVGGPILKDPLQNGALAEVCAHSGSGSGSGSGDCLTGLESFAGWRIWQSFLFLFDSAQSKSNDHRPTRNYHRSAIDNFWPTVAANDIGREAVKRLVCVCGHSVLRSSFVSEMRRLKIRLEFFFFCFLYQITPWMLIYRRI